MKTDFFFLLLNHIVLFFITKSCGYLNFDLLYLIYLPFNLCMLVLIYIIINWVRINFGCIENVEVNSYVVNFVYCIFCIIMIGIFVEELVRIILMQNNVGISIYLRSVMVTMFNYTKSVYKGKSDVAMINYMRNKEQKPKLQRVCACAEKQWCRTLCNNIRQNYHHMYAFFPCLGK